jgi:hypothetical protein
MYMVSIESTIDNPIPDYLSREMEIGGGDGRGVKGKNTAEGGRSSGEEGTKKEKKAEA